MNISDSITNVKQCIDQNLPPHLFKSMQEEIQGSSGKLFNPSTSEHQLFTYREEIQDITTPSTK